MLCCAVQCWFYLAWQYHGTGVLCSFASRASRAHGACFALVLIQQRGSSEIINQILDAAALAGSCGGLTTEALEDGQPAPEDFARTYLESNNGRGGGIGRRTPGAYDYVERRRGHDAEVDEEEGVGGGIGGGVLGGAEALYGGGDLRAQGGQQRGKGAMQQQEDIL